MVVKYRFRLYLFTLVILLGFGALAQRLWNLSVERHEEFVHKVPGTTVVRARIPGHREGGAGDPRVPRSGHFRRLEDFRDSNVAGGNSR